MTPQPIPHPPGAHPALPGAEALTPPPFPRILCAVDGSDESAVALEHAIALAGGDAHLTLAAVWTDPDHRPRAWGALELASARAREAGLTAVRRPIHAERVPDALAAAAAHFDLLVAGTQPHSRAAGILHHETMTALVHRCPVPLLVARERPLSAGVLAATDGRPRSRSALTAAGRVARRIGAGLTVVHIAEPDDHDRRAELAAELANIRALLGRDFRYIADFGAAAPRILAAAGTVGAGLVVVGSRGEQGLAAVASTSERVAHRAACSVLVERGR
jgi:nucleotide-binding universal stress UspA family protein